MAIDTTVAHATGTAETIGMEPWDTYSSSKYKAIMGQLKTLKIVKILMIFPLGPILSILACSLVGKITGQGAWVAAWLLFYPVVFLIIVRKAINAKMEAVAYGFVKERFAYAAEQAKRIAAEAHVAWSFREYDNAIPMWGRMGFLYFWIDTGDLLVIPRTAIKSVELEHIRLGATTETSLNHNTMSVYGSSLGLSFGKTKGSHTTTEQYEYRLDIYSTFEPFPCITTVFPDEDESTVKEIRGLLMH